MTETILIYVSIIGGILAGLKILMPPIYRYLKDNWFGANRISKNSDTIREIQKMTREQALILLLILDHIIDGNNVAEIKKTRRKFKEYLFNEEDEEDGK